MSLPPGNSEKVMPFPPCGVSSQAKEEHDIAEASDDEDIIYPEGGLRAWLVVLGSFCGMYVMTPNVAVQCKK